MENPDIPATVTAQLKKAKTQSLSVEAKKLILTVPYTDELLEDSVIELGSYVISEISSAFDTSMHQVIINGDTATGANVNINIIDANTSALDDGDVTDFIVINEGARKTAITNGTTVNAGTLDLTDIRKARASMGIKGVNPANIAMVVSVAVYSIMLGLSQVETADKFKDNATILKGVLTHVDGMKVVVREELGNATATGEISATPANNTTGQIVLIHLPSLWLGIRRNFSTEAERNVKEQQTEVTGSARVDVVFNDLQNNAEATSSCALIYNITL
ncbi:MAG: phage major capsid protein [Candidatus Helarchaeota archaeon]